MTLAYTRDAQCETRETAISLELAFFTKHRKRFPRPRFVFCENKICFTNNGTLRVKRPAQKPGQTPKTKKSLSFRGATEKNRSQ